MTLELVAGARLAYKWYSVRAAAISTAIPIIWGLCPDFWKSGIPVEWVLSAMAVVNIAGVVGRVIKQEPPCDEPAAPSLSSTSSTSNPAD